MKKYYLVRMLKNHDYKIIDVSKSKKVILHKREWWKKFGKSYRIIVLH